MRHFSSGLHTRCFGPAMKENTMAGLAVRDRAISHWVAIAMLALTLPILNLPAFTPHAAADGPADERRSARHDEPSGHCRSGPFAGTYVGAVAGLHFNDSSHEQGQPSTDHSGNTDNAYTFGVLGGRNWQCGGFVFGIEGDASFGGAKTTITYPGVQLSSSSDWYTTLRGRAGIADDNFMIYMTGGLALGGMTHDISAPNFGQQGSTSTVNFGYTVGAGMELDLGRWAVRAEGLFVDLGSTDRSYAVPGFGSTQWADAFWVARLGVSYKLGGSD